MSRNTGLSRRSFLKGMAATVPAAAVAGGLTTWTVRAAAFFNAAAFWKKPSGNGQTSNGYTIGQSLRISLASSAYLVRTPTATGSTTAYTFSFWAKRTRFGADQTIFDTGGYEYANFQSDDTLRFCGSWNGGSDRYITTTRVFRDPSAWYHIVLVYDANNATQSDRIRIYVNGTRETSLGVMNYPASTGLSTVRLNQSGNAHNIGRYNGGGTSYSDGYLAEFQFIDGYAYDPSYFGQIDSNTGQWIPKAYSGAYGVNGYYLTFADASNTTATTLGKDSAPISGAHTAANNWTPTNFNTHDQVLDSPTNNFPTLNPLDLISSANTPALATGNLTQTSNSWQGVARTTIAIPTGGKFYAEMTSSITTSASNGFGCGFYTSAANNINTWGTARSWGTYASAAGSLYAAGSTIASVSTFNSGDVFSLAIDFPKAWIGRNNSWYDSSGGTTGNPATGANPTFTLSLNTSETVFFTLAPSYGSGIVNCGQGGQASLTYQSASGGRFKYTPPTGFKALCTTNLSTPSIKMPSQHFDALAYQGTGSTSQAISGLGFTPGLLWMKNRGTADSNCVIDSLRGGGKRLLADTTATEYSNYNTIASFDSGGWTFGATDTQWNASSQNYIAWTWKSGGATGVSNTSGSITTTVSANTTAGFSVITYSGTSSGNGDNKTIGHGLGSAPKFIMIKARSGGAENWYGWHANLTGGGYWISLNQVGAQTSDATRFSQAPSSSLIYLGGNSGVCQTGYTYVAYAWAEVDGFSKFGTYTGNGATDGPFVYCGFKPRWILVRSVGSNFNWWIQDTAMAPYNGSSTYLFANSNQAQSVTTSYLVDVVSNGFKVRNTTADNNTNGQVYIFAAFAEAPFKYSTAR